MEHSLLWVILIANKNTSLNIIHALESIKKQMYSPIKIMVVDTNSPDSIYSLGLQEDLESFPQVDYRQIMNLNKAQLRNHIIDQIEGEYVAFISSNDIWDSTKAVLQIEQLRADPEAAASCSNGLLIDKRRENIIERPLFEQTAYDSSTWVINNPAKMSSQVIYRLDALKNVGGFDSQFNNYIDGDMLLRLRRNYKVLILSMSLCQCTITSDHGDYDLNNFYDYQKIYRKYMEYFIIKKSMALEYYSRMIELAKINYLWLNYIIYVLMYFSKAPVYSGGKILLGLGRSIKYTFKWIYRFIKLYKDHMDIKFDMVSLKRGQIAKTKITSPISQQIKEEMDPVILPLDRGYKKINTLDYSLNRKLISIIIPENVTVIKKYMFYGCDQLVSVVIPGSVVEISDHAFHGCKNLSHIIFKEGSRLETIGAYAFAGCYSLKSITIPSNIVSIGKGAFYRCVSLKQLLFSNIHQGIEDISKNIPTGLTKVAKYTFARCSSLSVIQFATGSMLEEIEEGAFIGCSNLRKILFTGNVRLLGNYAFAYCEKLAQVAFLQIDAIRYIGRGAFMGCASMDYFNIPKQIEHIYKKTFYGCSNLKMLKIPKTVLSINYQAFARCSLLKKVIIYTRDITISPRAFDRHTEVEILGPIDD